MMKAAALFLLFAVCYVECRKVYPQLNKNANVDFINMESGGVRGKPAAVEPMKPVAPGPPAPATPTTKAPVAAPVAKPVNPPSPNPAPKPVAPQPSKPAQPTNPKPVQTPNQIKPVPVNPAPVANPITTPGPGSVKSLINFYDSQGNASPIRPYSYSQAVKQG